MSKSTEKRDGGEESPAEGPGFFERIPSRIWFPAGFVAFFFIIGGWNQMASTWADLFGRPMPGSGQGFGLLTGSIVFAVCALLGLRASWRERKERRRDAGAGSHWRHELKQHREDIRFP